jgi:hypothetical protein
MIKSKVASKEKIYPAKGETVDHIPQQCLYNGYGSDYSKNRITVPSCRECNDNFSKIENDLRDLIGIANDKNKQQLELTRSGVKSILAQKDWLDRLYVDNNGNVRGVEFDRTRLELNHLKNFKGLYYKEFKTILPQDYNINIIDQATEEIQINYVFSFLEKNAIWKTSGHEDIFRYKLTLYKKENNQIIMTNKISDSLGIFCLLEYHKTVLILILGNKKHKVLKKL